MLMLYNSNDEDSIKKLSDYLDFLNKEVTKGNVQTFVIEIKKNRPIRSTDHNRHYWGVLKCIAVTAGYSSDDLHEYYKKRFNGKYVLDMLVGQTTTDLDSAEFNIYIKKVKEHGRFFFNAYIPETADKDYSAWEQMTKNNYDAMYSSI